jgi:hypothetical protein
MLETMTLTPVIWLNIALFPAEGLPISANCFDVVSGVFESEGVSCTGGHNAPIVGSASAFFGAVFHFFKNEGSSGICVMS